MARGLAVALLVSLSAFAANASLYGWMPVAEGRLADYKAVAHEFVSTPNANLVCAGTLVKDGETKPLRAFTVSDFSQYVSRSEAAWIRKDLQPVLRLVHQIGNPDVAGTSVVTYTDFTTTADFKSITGVELVETTTDKRFTRKNVGTVIDPVFQDVPVAKVSIIRAGCR